MTAAPTTEGRRRDIRAATLVDSLPVGGICAEDQWASATGVRFDQCPDLGACRVLNP